MTDLAELIERVERAIEPARKANEDYQDFRRVFGDKHPETKAAWKRVQPALKQAADSLKALHARREEC